MKKKINISHLLSVIFVTFFLALLFRNPFSERTLIPNLEPFPDSFYYITPIRCFIKNLNWNMCREDAKYEGIATVVTPLYSISLLPLFLIHNDPRVFYFTNVILALASFLIFIRIVDKLGVSVISKILILLVYSSNYYIYWLPTVAMAENLLLFLIMLLIFIQTNDTSNKFIASFLIAIAVSLTKFSLVPYAGAIIIVAFIRSLLESNQTEKKVTQFINRYTVITSFILIVLFLNTAAVELVVKTFFNSNVFSASYFFDYAQFYFNVIYGEKTRFLWHSRAIYDQWIFWGLLIGFCTSLKNKRTLITSFVLIIPFLLHVIFISTFYAADARYIIQIIPIAFYFIAVAIKYGERFFQDNLKNIGYTFILICITVGVALNAFQDIKLQLALNLKYAETPWWYISVKHMNNYFIENPSYGMNGQKPAIITLASPFLIDYYANSNFEVLPLDTDQDFRGNKMKVWGVDQDIPLIEQYKQRLASGQRIFINPYGVLATKGFQDTYSLYEKNFRLEERSVGCHNLCTIYEMKVPLSK